MSAWRCSQLRASAPVSLRFHGAFREQPGGPEHRRRTREASRGGCAHPETDVLRCSPSPASPHGGPSVKDRALGPRWSSASMQGHRGGAAVPPPDGKALPVHLCRAWNTALGGLCVSALRLEALTCPSAKGSEGNLDSVVAVLKIHICHW